MIAKMKKLTFLIYHKEYDAFLENLRDLGVVHIAQKAQGTSESADIQNILKQNARYTLAIKSLKKLASQKEGVTADKQRGKDILEQYESMQLKKTELQHSLQSIQKEIEILDVWGDFAPISISRLEENGYKVDFYVCQDKYFKEEWKQTYCATEINRIGSKIFFITITKSLSLPPLEVESIKIPSLSLSQLKDNEQKTYEKIESIDNSLIVMAQEEVSSLDAAQHEIQSQLDLSNVKLNTQGLADNKLLLLQGWAPAVKVSGITEALDKSGVYYEVTNPTPEDVVPIELENKGFFKLFEPIMRLYMLPKYNELDLTPFFAPFFMLFFGLCLGDSGYGLFMVIGVILYRIYAKNISSSMKPILTLIQILGASTFFCGLLTGTFFGFNIYGNNIPFFQKMRDILFLDNQWMFNFSLILGAIQIIFGMFLKAYNKYIQFGFKYSLSTIGWIIVLISTAIGYFAKDVLPMDGTLYLCLISVGAALIFLINSPGKNIFLNIGLGLWDSYNMVTGLLGDILSYVRLFALGLSGGILAGVFNSLAVGMSPDNVILGPIVMVLIFFIGHSINMFMNILGAMVHPMRLTFVEFFKNSGYEGGGKEYKPFKK